MPFKKIKDFLNPKKINSTAIVYFAYINPLKDWQLFIANQLNDLKKTDILSASDLHIVVSNPFKVSEVEGFFKNRKHLYKTIEFHEENKFEYWGINYIWNLAREHKYDYLIYFHTKGISHENDKRSNKKEMLTHYTFNKWQSLVKIFEENKDINKIGLFPGWELNQQGEVIKGGWIWYNFWWARSSYIRTLEHPNPNPKTRYYYESWLSTSTDLNHNKLQDNFSIYSMDKTLYTGQETLENMEKLIKKTKK
ncbi:hypothetical protein [Thiolinea disciformis]|uniref:hypothetical protein n=1 Tax=Thiolinea disciformis TaxID=125614 RepID=UPI00036A22B8|nr:hypothetical protein [Thiolinea disciformis]